MDGVGVATLSGAASGALAATGVGLFGSVAGNAAISMVGNAADQVIKNHGFSKFDTTDMVIEGVIGGISGGAGGSGASRGNAKSVMSLGRQLTRRIKKTGEVRAAFSYYTKNMKTTGGKSIFTRLRKSLDRGGAVSFFGKTIKGCLR